MTTTFYTGLAQSQEEDNEFTAGSFIGELNSFTKLYSL